jgi:hypothetical protein
MDSGKKATRKEVKCTTDREKMKRLNGCIAYKAEMRTQHRYIPTDLKIRERSATASHQARSLQCWRHVAKKLFLVVCWMAQKRR